MTRTEVLEFLELPESATDNDIRSRMNDKLDYFQRLSENAPNDFLRKLHISNTEKIRTLQVQMGSAAPAASQPASQSQLYHHAPPTQSHNKAEVAWLVRHTENMTAKTFPLYYGQNYIGRNPQVNAPCIIVDDDPYVSRIHTLLEVININPLRVVVSDNSISNNGKPSKNGTYVNGNDKRLEDRMTIGPNDTVQIGMTKFIVRLNDTSLHKIVQQVEESDYMKTVVIDVF